MTDPAHSGGNHAQGLSRSETPTGAAAAHSPGAPAAFAHLLLTWNEEPNGMGVFGRNRL